MIFGQDRDELRRMYRDAWRKHSAGELFSPLESQIAAVVAEHPEYREYVESGALDAEYRTEDNQTNPFLHMGLHLAIREQVSADRPPGITAVRQALAERLGDAHRAEHAMMEALAETLWEAQRDNQAPDDRVYLERLRRLG